MIEGGAAFAFWVLAVGTCLAALGVVFLRNLVHALLLLVICFAAIAGIYVTLSADFLAAVQLLIYAGAISILIIFAIMLTRRPERGSPFGRFSLPALIVSATMLIALIWVTVGLTDWAVSAQEPLQQTTEALADRLFNSQTGFVLAFEVASAVLLAAMIGAIVIIAEREK